MSEKGKLSDFRRNVQPTIKEAKFTLKKIRESPLSLIGMGLVLFFVVIAVLAPVLAPPKEIDPFMIPYPKETSMYEPVAPNAQHPFGTTSFQDDLYYGCIWGTLFAFRLGLIVIVLNLSIGIVLGLIAGYYGGIIDELLMRFTDIILAFPSLILVMALIISLSSRGISRIDAATIGIVLVGWPGYTRLIRGEVLRVKSEDYIEAAKASGASDIRVISRHVLPNAIYPVVIVGSLDFGTIVLFAAALGFLGLGAPQRYADWGQLINTGSNWVSYGLRYWWTYVFPGVFITLFVLGWNLLGDAFRDILDPLYRRK